MNQNQLFQQKLKELRKLVHYYVKQSKDTGPVHDLAQVLKIKVPQQATTKEEKEVNPIVKSISAAIQRFVIGASFIVTKQPARIAQILRQVYPIDAKNVDDELVESIRYPSLDPNASEVFYRVITKNGSGPGVFIDDLLKNLECPLLLCWGE